MATNVYVPPYKVRRKFDENGECYHVVERPGKRKVIIFKMGKGQYKPVQHKALTYGTLRDAIIGVVFQ
jgi:hypothetical protein